jgi:hypothetical protein
MVERMSSAPKNFRRPFQFLSKAQVGKLTLPKQRAYLKQAFLELELMNAALARQCLRVRDRH